MTEMTFSIRDGPVGQGGFGLGIKGMPNMLQATCENKMKLTIMWGMAFGMLPAGVKLIGSPYLSPGTNAMIVGVLAQSACKQWERPTVSEMAQGALLGLGGAMAGQTLGLMFVKPVTDTVLGIPVQ